jgi:hypothetical protein
MSYIKPQITPPSPLIFAILNRGSKRRIISAGLGSPRGKPAENTRHLTWRVGGGRLGEVWFGSLKKFVLPLLALFSNFKAKRQRKGSKNKNIFDTCVLELNLAIINGLGGSILSKKVKIVVPYCTCYNI